MKFVVVFLVIIVAIWLIGLNNDRPGEKNLPKSIATSKNIKITNQKPSMSVFIPYWNIDPQNSIQNPINDLSMTKFYYFGVTITENGYIDKSDQGFVSLSSVEPTNSVLVVRIIDQNIVDSLIEKHEVVKHASKEVAILAKEFGFEGILIDLEYSALPTSTTRSDITNTLALFVETGHQEGLRVGATIYGDTFYRGRPYDIQKIGSIVDELVVMAYDFHKSKSLPGPLFPFNDNNYGYSFKALIHDFTTAVPADKVTIAYGTYGYQWETDKKKRPIRKAVALPMKNIRVLASGCNPPKCTKVVDLLSNELVITNHVENGYVITHSETEASIQTKIDFARRSGVFSSVLWTNGYW